MLCSPKVDLVPPPIMVLKASVLTILALLFAIVLATPEPTPAPVLLDPQLAERQIGSFISSATSRAVSFISHVTSDAASVAGDVFTSVTSIGGHAVTVVSSKGGDVITLATSGAGVATSKFGSVYTVATAAVASAATHTGGAAPLSLGLQTPSLVGLATVLLSTLLGAIIVA